MIQYFVIARHTCPTCKGERYLLNPAWQRYSAANGDVRAFFSSEGYETIPPEEEECYHCNALGYIETKVSLAEALVKLQKESKDETDNDNHNARS